MSSLKTGTKANHLNWKKIQNDTPIAYNYFINKLTLLGVTELEKQRFLSLDSGYITSIVSTIFQVLKHPVPYSEFSFDLWEQALLDEDPNYEADEALFYRLFYVLEYQLNKQNKIINNLTCPYENFNY